MEEVWKLEMVQKPKDVWLLRLRDRMRFLHWLGSNQSQFPIDSDGIKTKTVRQNIENVENRLGVTSRMGPSSWAPFSHPLFLSRLLKRQEIMHCRLAPRKYLVQAEQSRRFHFYEPHFSTPRFLPFLRHIREPQAQTSRAFIWANSWIGVPRWLGSAKLERSGEKSTDFPKQQASTMKSCRTD